MHKKFMKSELQTGAAAPYKSGEDNSKLEQKVRKIQIAQYGQTKCGYRGWFLGMLSPNLASILG